jgi:hypothetical protein
MIQEEEQDSYTTITLGGSINKINLYDKFV